MPVNSSISEQNGKKIATTTGTYLSGAHQSIMPQSTSLVCSHSPRKLSEKKFESSCSIITFLVKRAEGEERNSVSLSAAWWADRCSKERSNKPQFWCRSQPYVRIAFEIIHPEYGEVMLNTLAPIRLGVLNFLIQVVGVKLIDLRIPLGPL